MNILYILKWGSDWDPGPVNLNLKYTGKDGLVIKIAELFIGIIASSAI